MSDKLLTHLFDAEPPRNRRDEITATVVSLLGHILVLALLIAIGGRKVASVVADLGVGDGIGIGLAGGGGGGGDDDAPVAITVAEAPPAPKEEPKVEPVPPPVPVPEPEIKPEIKPIEVPSIALPTMDTMPRIASVLTGTGNGQGTGNGPGTGQGTGPGSGGGSGGGDGGGIGSGRGPGSGRGALLGASPEVLLIPPPAPGSVRGKAVLVRLAVDATGVVRDVEIVPSTGDRKFDGQLKKTALGWRFRPARDSQNQPVATSFEVTFTF